MVQYFIYNTAVPVKYNGTYQSKASWDLKDDLDHLQPFMKLVFKVNFKKLRTCKISLNAMVKYT